MLFTREIKKGNAEELIIGGKKLSDFTTEAEVITTGVEGRDGYQAEPEIIDDIDGREGGVFLDTRLPSRTITVHYLHRAKSTDAYRMAFNDMAQELAQYRVPTQISFNDESEWAFNGILKEFSVPSPGKLSVDGELVFICPDPYKYGLKKRIPPGSKAVIGKIPFPLYADEIILKPGIADSVTVKNITTGRRIKILISTTEQDVVKIEGNKIYKNIEPVTRYVDYTVSDLHGFVLHTGDIIQAESGTVEIMYRERRL